MNSIKKLLGIAACTLSVAVLVGCPKQNATTQGGEQGATVPTSAPKTIAVATLMTHPALDEAAKGMKEELAAKGFKDGQNVKFIERNANGQVQVAANIARDLAAQNPDVIVAITTPMAQAVAKTAKVPVVFAAVTDPVGAKLVPSLTQAKENITGTSDAWPYQQQLDLVKKITPSARRIGVLFNPGEAASQYGMRQIRLLAPKMGFTLVEGSVDTTADVARVASNIADRVDALFLSSDNTVIGGSAGAVKVAFNKKKPLYVGDSGTVEKGGLAAASVGYAGLGRDTGDLVARVLNGETKIPTVVCRGNEIYINAAAAKKMGVIVPPDVLKSAKKVFNTIKG